MTYAAPSANGWIDMIPVYRPGKAVDSKASKNPPVKLSSNENILGGPKRLRDLLLRVEDIDPSRYPDDRYSRLTRRIADEFYIDPEQIILSAGSSEMLTLIARSFLSPGKLAIVSEYSFALYRIVTHSTGATSRVVNSRSYGHDLDSLLKAIKNENASIVFIDNPCNPTGAFIRDEDLINFLDQVPRETLVVIDEAYQEYRGTGLTLDYRELTARFPHVIFVRTFSKVYGLAGLRLGYAMAHEDLINTLRRLRSPFNVSSLAEEIGIQALQDPVFVLDSVAMVKRQKSILQERLAAYQTVHGASEGNFLFLNVGERKEALLSCLQTKGISIRDFEEFPGHVRITMGLDAHTALILEACREAGLILTEEPAS